MLSVYTVAVIAALYSIVPFNVFVWISCITGVCLITILAAAGFLMAIPYLIAWRGYKASNGSILRFLTDPVYADECMTRANDILAEVGYLKLERKGGELLWEGNEFSEQFGKALGHFVAGLRTFQPILHAANTSCEFKVVNTNTKPRKYMLFDSESYVYSCDEKTKNWYIRRNPSGSQKTQEPQETQTTQATQTTPAVEDDVRI
jgi:hypothetical protein